MEKKIVVTLARQHYTGGLKVGKYLAEALGVNCYDSEMLRLVSDDQAMHDSYVAHDSRIKGTSLFDVATIAYREREEGEFSDPETMMKNIFDYQSDIIRKLAEKESCVIVGRCANYILRERIRSVYLFMRPWNSGNAGPPRFTTFRMRSWKPISGVRTKEGRIIITAIQAGSGWMCLRTNCR